MLIALELALAATMVAAIFQKTGYDRIKGTVGPLGFMVAAALAPRLHQALSSDPMAVGSLLTYFVGAMAVGLLFSSERLSASGSCGYRSWSWSSGLGGWRSSSSSSSSSRSSSSSSFSGGGGRSGGGGASSSW